MLIWLLSFNPSTLRSDQNETSPYNIFTLSSKQVQSYMNIQTYQVEVVIVVLHQILITNLQGYVQQLEERIDNEI